MTIKVLLCGRIKGLWDVLINRLSALQSSSHGPFHALFMLGPVFENQAEFNLVAEKYIFPLPVYIFETSGLTLPSSNQNIRFINNNNSGVGLETIMNLTVTFYSSQSDTKFPNDLTNAQNIVQSRGYRGCDLLLSSEWPADVHQFLEPSSISSNILGGQSSISLGTFARTVKPRYHFADGKNIFFQRIPYINEIGPSGRPVPCTRFIGLAHVNESKDKDRKWLHALSLEPIIHMSDTEVAEIPTGSTDCPYVIVGKKKPRLPVGPPPESVKKVKTNDGEGGSGRFASIDANNVSSGALFFGKMGVARPQSVGRELPVAGGGMQNSTSNSHTQTLFVGGIDREVTNSELLRKLPGSVSVSRPLGKNFAFIDFSTPAAAQALMASSKKQSVMIGRRAVDLGWAKPRQSGNEQTLAGETEPETKIELDPPSLDATKLYIGGLPLVYFQEELLMLLPGSQMIQPVLGKGFCFVEMINHESAAAAVKSASLNPLQLRDKTLSVGWAKSWHDSSNKNRNYGYQRIPLLKEAPSPDAKTLFIRYLGPTVNEADIRLLFADYDVHSVTKPAGKNYAFVEFIDSTAASKAMDGVGAGEAESVMLKGASVAIGWARSQGTYSSRKNENCWFCLGSSTVKTHLIVSVADHTYLALPRGGIVDDHMLIIPIECVSNRLLLSADAKKEFVKYEKALSSYYQSTRRSYLLFERNIRTSVREHMQTHLVPLTETQSDKCVQAFLNAANRHNLPFTEIQSNEDMDEIILSQEGDPNQEYFYIQLPGFNTSPPRRFIFVPSSTITNTSYKFPLNFGLEVAAESIGARKKANWKNCLLSEREEEILAEAFKQAFTSFDFMV